MSHLKQQNNFEEKLKEQLDGMEWKPSNSLWDRIEQNMDADSFEPALQNKLANYSLEPHAEVWENVEAQLPEKDNRKGFLWLSVISFVLLASFGAGYWFREVEVENKVAVNAAGQSNTFQQAQTTNKVSVRTDKNEIEKAKEKVSSNAPKDKQSIQVKAAKQSIKKVKQNENNLLALRSHQRAKKALKGASSTRTNKLRNGNILLAIQSVSTIGGTVISSSNIVAGIIDANRSQSANENLANPLGRENEPKILDAASIPSNPAPNVNVKEIPSASILMGNAADTFAENKPFRGSSYIAPEENLTNFSLTAFAGLNWGVMQLKMPATSNNANIIKIANLQNSYNLRKSMESASIDFTGGLLLNYHFHKSWFVSIGIGMTNLKQDVSFNTKTAQQPNPVLVQPVNQYVHPGDSIIAGAGNTYENKYSFTEIPLLLGYQLPSEGDFNFSLMGGVSYAQLNLVNAFMPDPACIGILVVTDKESFPKFKDVLFLSIAPAVSYKLNGSVEIGSMLQGKMALNNMVGDLQWVQQRPYLLGLNLFIRKHF